MSKYKKPAVVRSGYTPEPVEAGCCLTSCGGSPGGMQAGRHLSEQAGAAAETIDKAKADLKPR